jgi:1-deoxy-D-xylulose-5-phosphate reductoisomerase
LHFEKQDPVRFPVLELARRAMEAGGTLPAVLNAANEIAVDRFLAGEIQFTRIPALTGEVMRKHTSVDHPSLDEVLRADAWARRETRGSA